MPFRPRTSPPAAATFGSAKGADEAAQPRRLRHRVVVDEGHDLARRLGRCPAFAPRPRCSAASKATSLIRPPSRRRGRTAGRIGDDDDLERRMSSCDSPRRQRASASGRPRLTTTTLTRQASRHPHRLSASPRSGARRRGCSAPRTRGPAPRPRRTAPARRAPGTAAAPAPPASPAGRSRQPRIGGERGRAGRRRRRHGARPASARRRRIVAGRYRGSPPWRSRARGRSIPNTAVVPPTRPARRSSRNPRRAAPEVAQHRRRDLRRRMRAQSPATRSETNQGGVSGASPCRFTTMSKPPPSAS